MAILMRYRIILLICFILNNCIISQSSGYNEKCVFVTQKESFVITGENSVGLQPYDEIHVRHNLKVCVQSDIVAIN